MRKKSGRLRRNVKDVNMKNISSEYYMHRSSQLYNILHKFHSPRMKASFEVQEEGFDEEDENEQQELLQTFIDYIKKEKIVVLEDLAAHFKLKTQAAIDRIIELQKDDRLSGVIDDRGKFIYISEDELRAVAKFIRQRGRVSISELAENSNRLINLSSVA